MPSLDRRIGPGVFEPEQLTALRQLFEEACTLVGASTDSAEADDIAMKVLTAFQSGYVDRETMFAALLDSKSAADTNVNTNRIFLWISAVEPVSKVRSGGFEELAAFGAAFDAEQGPAQTRHQGISIDAAQMSEPLQCRNQGRSVEVQALLQPVFEQFTEGTVTADLKAPERLLVTLSKRYLGVAPSQRSAESIDSAVTKLR